MIDAKCALVRVDKTERELFIEAFNKTEFKPWNQNMAAAWWAWQERGRIEQVNKSKEVSNG